jgi:hypothetical protein
MSQDKTWWLLKARDKRQLAAFARRAAAFVSLNDEREVLLADAAALEAEAGRIESEHGIGASSQGDGEA